MVSEEMALGCKRRSPSSRVPLCISLSGVWEVSALRRMLQVELVGTTAVESVRSPERVEVVRVTSESAEAAWRIESWWLLGEEALRGRVEHRMAGQADT